jgi:AT-rich DNA-binding protein
MSDEVLKYNIKLPEPTLRRMPWYLAYLKLLKDKGEESVSSTQISKEINVDASQIAKDLSFLNITGKTRVGYDVNSLVDVLEDFLGFTKTHRAFIFGAGSLGAALLHDNGLEQYGLRVVAAFDVNPKKIGTVINGIPVYDINDYNKKRSELQVNIGILTVPVDKAQDVADQMIEGGIKAIWNFTPFRIKVPKHIVVQNTSIYAHLAVMFNRLTYNTIEKGEKFKIS